MSAPTPFQMTPDELTKLANTLATASETVRQSVYQDPVMLTDAVLYAEYFGPPQEVAQRYIDLAGRFKTYATATMNRLTQGAEVFRSAATEFAAHDAANARGVQTGAQPR